METENEKKNEEKSVELSSGSREGYQPTGQQGDYQKFRAPGRSPRPRIHTPRPYNAERATYGGKSGADEARIPPQKASAQGCSQAPQGHSIARAMAVATTPRLTARATVQAMAAAKKRYQQRPGYANRGGYQQQNGYAGRQGGYQQRGGYNAGAGRGGYQQRGGYGAGRQGGYQQSYNADGEGYANYRQGGYQQRGYGNGAPRQSYGQGRPGGYQQRGGYGQRPGGYRQQGGGFQPNPKANFKKRIDYKDDNIDPNAPIRLNKYLANAGGAAAVRQMSSSRQAS